MSIVRVTELSQSFVLPSGSLLLTSYLNSGSYDSKKITAGDLAHSEAFSYLATTGSNTFNGNQTISGSISTTDSMYVGEDILPLIPSQSRIGTLQNPFAEIFLKSGSVYILSDIVGAPAGKITNTQGDISIESAGFSIRSGSIIPFQIEPSGLATIRTPQPQIGHAVLNISANPTSSVYPLASTVAGGVVHLTGDEKGPTLLTIDNFDNTNPSSNSNAVVLRNFRGTPVTPLATQYNDVLGTFTAVGYNGTGLPPLAQNWIRYRAIENYSSTAMGAKMEIMLVPSGSTTQSIALTLDNHSMNINGSLTASLQQGYMWVGDGGDISTAIPTSSFALTSGSNTFHGDQTISGSLYVSGSSNLNGNTNVTGTLSITNVPTGATSYNVLVINPNTNVVSSVPQVLRTTYGLFSQTGNSITISGTTAETSVIDGGVGTLTVQANQFSIGDSFRADLAGNLNSASNETIRIRVKTGNVILVDSGLQTLSPGVTNNVWTLSINFTIRQVGTAGTASIVSIGRFTYAKTQNATVEGFSFNTVNNTTFDTTINNTLDITVQFGSTNVANRINSDVFILNKIY